MSLFTRLWQFIRRPTGYVGRDLEGNTFFEYPGEWRSRRVVRFKGRKDMFDLATGQQRLVVQWRSWLSHTRVDPPTIEELQVDALRQVRLQRNVALIEERDRLERQRRAIQSSSEANPTLRHSIPSTIPNSEEPRKCKGAGSGCSTNCQKHHKAARSHSTAEQEPAVPPVFPLVTQSWNPVSVRKRG